MQASGVGRQASDTCRFAACDLQFANLLLRWCVVLSFCVGVPARAEDDEANYILHELSLWGLDPTLEQANELQHYPSAMPGVVDTDRSRANEQHKLTPLAVITLRGEPVKDLEIDLRAQSGRFIGHWPPAESKSGRLRWLDLATVSEADKDALLATVDEKHWFNQARQLDALFVKEKSRTERFLAYDFELKYELPVQVAGGPETYLITNAGKHSLLDVFVLAPKDGGMQIGHLETLAPSKPKAGERPAEQKPDEQKPDEQKPAEQKPAEQKPAEGKSTETAPPEKKADEKKADEKKPDEKKSTEKESEEEKQEEKPAEVEETPAAAPVAAPAAVVPGGAPVAPGAAPVQGGAAPATAPAATPAVPLEPTELPMSAVVALDSDEFKSVRETLAASLLKLGLPRGEVDLLFDRAGPALFETKEMIVLFRLPPEAIEERLPLVAYPAPRKTVRAALVVVRNLDPQIKDEVRKLIADLGSPEYTCREQAEKRLTELGRLAVPALKTALKSSDLEIVFRAERILLAQNEKLEGT